MHSLLPFSGVILTVPASKSMPLHLNLIASPALTPVFLSRRRKVDAFRPELAIRASSSLSLGINGSFSSTLNLGGPQVFSHHS
jgi:hypothetical protein